MSTIWFKAVKEFISKKSSSLTHMGNGTLTGTLYPCNRYWSVAMRRSCAISNIISTDPVYINLYKNRMSVNKKSSSQFGDGAVMQTRFNFHLSCPRPNLVLGVKPHSDRSGIIVLLQDKARSRRSSSFQRW